MVMKFILASQSPRRLELFSRLRLSFKQVPAEVDETVGDAPPPPEIFAENIARSKAEAVARLWKDHTVVGADTVVVAGGRILGKPGNEDRAWEMLSLLNGRRHRVVTGIAVVQGGHGITWTGVKVTEVEFHQVSEGDLRDYIRGGEPFDKAGGYGIQEKGRFLVKLVSGCYSNVVGLPLCLLVELLRKAGMDGSSWDEAAVRCCVLPYAKESSK